MKFTTYQSMRTSRFQAAAHKYKFYIFSWFIYINISGTQV
jgi:hypothetical protein